MPSLRFGIHAGQQYASFDEYLAMWQHAEDIGLDWASVFDHFLPIQADPAGPCFEAFSLLSAMAAHTSRLQVGVLVTGVTYRNPALLANIAATIDHVSHGRMNLGIGAAWYELEHDQYHVPFPSIGTRMDMLDEACRVLKALWTQPRATVAGKHFGVTDALCEPKPVQSPMPLWVGGAGEQRTLRIVAEHATGWNTFHGDPETYKHKLDVLAAHCADVGRDPADIRKQIVFRAILDDTTPAAVERASAAADRAKVPYEQFTQGMIVGTPAECAATLAAHRDLGVQDFLMLSRPPADHRTMDLLASEVAAELRG